MKLHTLFFGFLAVAGFSSPALAHELYWTDAQNRIHGADIDGSNASVIYDGTGMDGLLIDVVATDTHLYWTDNAQSTAAGGIWRAERDGGNAERLVENLGTFSDPQFIAVDEAGNKLYFTCWQEGVFSADLDDGSDLTFITRPSGSTTGIALIDSDEAFVINAAGNNTNLYRVNFADQTATVEFEFVGHGAAQYGLAFDPDAGAEGTAYVSNFGDGAVDAYDLAAGTESGLIAPDGLVEPLGLGLNPSRSHLVVVERGSGHLIAYEFASGESFTAAPVGSAHFGVAVLAEPSPIPPPVPADPPIVETFENGTPGESIVNRSTSDGKGLWRQSARGSDSTLNYGGEPGEVTYEPFAPSGRGDVRLDVDVDGVEDYIIKFDDVLLRGGNPFLDSYVAIGARKTDGSDLGTYRIRQWRVTDEDEGTTTFRYGIHYLDPEGETDTRPGNWRAETVPTEDVEGGDYSGSELLRENLELRVRGNQQRLFLDGDPLGEWQETQGTYDDGNADLALVINTTSSGSGSTFTHPVFHGLTLEEPPPPPEVPEATDEWQLVDDFAGRDLGPIAGQDGWQQPSGGLAEVIDNPFGNGRVLRVGGGTHAKTVNIPDGETGTVFFRARSIGRSDFSFGASHQLEPGNISGTAAAQFAFRTSSRNGIDIVEEGNSIRNLGLYNAHTWYHVWIVINNDENFSNYYIQGGEFDEPTLLLYEPSEGDPRSAFPFRHNQAGEAIKTFGFQAFNPGLIYIDEIWFNGLTEDLTAPSPLPAPEDKTNDGPLPAYEGFSYSTGEVLGLNGGFSWAEPYRPSGDRQSPVVGEGSLAYENVATEGNRLIVDGTGGRAETFRFLDLGFTPTESLADGLLGAPGSDVYLSFVVDGGDTVDAPFWGVSTFRNQSERLFIGKSQNQDHWAIQTPGAADRSEADPDEAPLTGTSFIVVRHYYLSPEEIDAQELEEDEDPILGRVYLFHNPDLADGEPAVEDAAASFETTNEMIFNRFRITANDSGNGFELDEIRVGTTWEAVTPVDDAEPPEGYEDWAGQFFTQDEMDDPSISGPSADPDGDGILNLMEFALGGNPTQPDRGILPAEGRESVDGEDYLTLTFSRPADVTGVDYSVDTAGDPGAVWNLGAAIRVGDPVEEDGLITETWRDTEPIGEERRRFLRLRVISQ